ncbi:HAD family phosphatase [Stenotrophomonas sp. MMGLT7]|uniref:HAD family hydrolase n=1 Tax=Stenotrophomonas sp. MMGLT7 TaxID=2901227 RepID=UPI001E642638|nr:HAD family phosphatase [Stenotrophomonas sp. MMGLT7]
MAPPLRLVLFDFDGVLARYSRHARVLHLAAALDRRYASVEAALFGSGLETRYDSGQVDTAGYLAELGERLSGTVDAATWSAARLAATRPEPRALSLLQAVSQGTDVAVLTNNGALMEAIVNQLAVPAAPALRGRILCSGTLGTRKPDPAAYRLALERLGADAAQTLFVDDLFVNVRGARAAGLHADSARDSRSLARLLKRYRLL